jgi:hypothetical protein
VPQRPRNFTPREEKATSHPAFDRRRKKWKMISTGRLHTCGITASRGEALGYGHFQGHGAGRNSDCIQLSIALEAQYRTIEES